MAETQAPRGNRKPGWMSMPGGPKEPNRQAMRDEFTRLLGEKRKCFDRIAELRDQLVASRGDNPARAEREQLWGEMQDIASKRADRVKEGRAKNDKMKATRLKVQALKNELSELEDVSAFESVEEIDMAIDRVHYKMETGRGGLQEEKKCQARLKMLDKAKDLLLRIEPLMEAIEMADEEERMLRDDAKREFEKARELNSEYEKKMELKIKKSEEEKKTTVDRKAITDQMDAQRKLANEYNDKIDALKTTFDEAMEKWEAWKVEAKKKWQEEQDRIYAEREAKRKAIEKEKKDRIKAEKMLKRLNPFADQIAACTTLIRYLEDKTRQHKSDKEAAERRKKAAAFDPSSAVPAGMVLQKDADEDWMFTDRKGKKGKKQPAKPAPKPAGEEKEKKEKERPLNHSVEKYNAFAMVNVDVPLVASQIPKTLEVLREKKKEYESHKKEAAEQEVSSDEDEEEEEGNAVDETVAAASTVVDSKVLKKDDDEDEKKEESEDEKKDE